MSRCIKAALMAASTLAILSPGAQAATQTWGNTSTDFNTAADWTSGTIPAPGDTALFSGAPFQNPNLSASLSIGQIAFDTGGYTLSSSGTGVQLTLTAATAINATNTSGTTTISAPIILGQGAGGTATFNQAGGGTLVISGPISESGTGTKVSLTTSSSSNNMLYVLSGSNSYTGTTQLGQHVSLNINNSYALGNGGALLIATSSPGSIDNTSGTAITLLSNNSVIFGAGTGGLSFTGSSDLSFGSGTFAMSGASRTITVNASTLTFGSIDSSSTAFVLTKAGAGTLVISNAAGATFQGGVSLNAGNLVVGNVAAIGSGTLVLGGGTFNSQVASGTYANILSMTTNSGITGSNSVTMNGDLTQTASRTLTNTLSPGSTLTLGGKVNIDAVTGTALTLTLAGTGNTNITGVIEDFSGGVGTSHGGLTITNSGTTTLSAANTYQGATSFTGAGRLNLTGTLSNSNITVNNAGGVFNESSTGVITGTNAFTLTAGTVFLSGSNSYSGATTVSSGTLNLTGKIGASAMTVGGNAVLTGTGTIGTTTSATGGTVSLAVLGGAGTAQGVINLTDGGIGTLTIQGNTSGGTFLTVGGTGAGNASALSFETGNTSVDQIAVTNSGNMLLNAGGGTVNIGVLSGQALNSGTYNLITYGAGSTLTGTFGLGSIPIINGTFVGYKLNTTSTALQLISTGPMTALSSVYWKGGQDGLWNTVNSGTSNWATDVSGATTAAPPGTNTNVFFGATTSATNSLTLGQDFTVNSLNFTGAGTSGTSGYTITGNTITLLASGTNGMTIQAGSAGHTINSKVVLGSSQTWENDSTNSVTLAGAVALGSNNLTFTGSAGSNYSMITTISGSGQVIISTNGTVTFGATAGNSGVNNTFSGGLILNSGVLSLGGGGTGNSAPNVMGTGSFIVNGGTLTANGNIANSAMAITNQVWNADWTYSGGKNLKMGTGAITLGTSAGTTRVLNVSNAAGTLTLGGGISNGTTADSLTKTGAGLLVMSGSSNYTGTTTLSAGTIQVGHNNALGAGAALVVNGGTLNLGGFNPTVGAFSGTGGTVTTTTGTSVLATSSSANTTYSGSITNGSGQVGLNVNGPGQLTLSGSNSYTGATNVANGALKVNGILGNTAVTVGNASTGSLTPTLGGGNGSATGGSLVSLGNSPSRQVYASSGSIGNIAGAVTISGTSAGASAGHLAPGNSVGTLTVGSLTLSGGSILDYEFNGSANDFTVVTGALSLNSGTTGINLYQEGTTTQFTTSGTYDLFQYGSLVGSVSNLAVLNPSGGNTYTFGTATVGGTNYVTLTVAAGGGATSTTYTLTATAGSTNILTGGTTSIASVVQNTGSGSADTLNYSGLTATSGSGGSISGSPTSGGPLGQGASGTNGGLTFTGTHSGAVTVTAVGSGTNATLNTAASQTGTNTATVNVWDAASLSTSQSGSNMQASNLSGSFRASAKITSDGGLTNNQGFVNVNVNGQQINSGSSITVANFDSTGKLNGSYSATKTVGYDNVTTSGSAITGGTGNTANLTLTATVSGQTAGAGQVLGAPVFSGQKYGTTTVGGTSSGFGLTSNISSDPHSPTTATIINGTASAATTVLMSFDKVPAGSEPDNAFRVSDILTLSGLVKTGGTGHDGSTLTDIYVLQLSYDSTATGQKYLGWYDATQNQWVNAVAGNSNGGPYDGTGEYVGSYASYLASLSVPDQTNLSAQLGAFGYDASTHTAWAVVDHESEFAVIPEPGTWGMIISGFGMLIGIQRLRKRRVGT